MTKTSKRKLVKTLKGLIDTDDYAGIRYFFEQSPRTKFFMELFAKTFFAKFYKYDDAPYHEDIDDKTVKIITGLLRHLNLIGFKECAKTAKVKIAVCYAIITGEKKFVRILSADITNAERFVTDVYNMLSGGLMKKVYPNILTYERGAKKSRKRNHFTTNTGATMESKSILGGQRGQSEEEKRPDLVICDDIETYATLFSNAITKKIFYSLKSARSGMDNANGSFILLGNYISDTGNVHAYLQQPDAVNIVIPMIDADGKPSWGNKYVLTDKEAQKVNKKRDKENRVVSIETIQRDPMLDWNEYQCIPVSAKDLYFSLDRINELIENAPDPIEESNGQKIYEKVIENMKYSNGVDVAEGVGRDLSTSTILKIEDELYTQVFAYESNEIDPYDYALELIEQGEEYNEAFITPENNSIGKETVGTLSRKYNTDKIYRHTKDDEVDGQEKQSIKYGWTATKSSIIKAYGHFRKDFNAGKVIVVDKDTLLEMRHFKLSDLTAVGTEKKENRHVVDGSHFDRLRAMVLAHAGIEKAIEEKYMGIYFA